MCLTSLKVGDTGVIHSPGFPAPYPDSASCLWLLQTDDPDHRIVLNCDVINLESCGVLGRDSPRWRDYLVISPLWSFKKV